LKYPHIAKLGFLVYNIRVNEISAKYETTAEAKALNPARHGLDGLVLIGYSRFMKTREPTEEHIHPDILEIGFCERKSLVLNVSGTDYRLMPGDFFVNQPNIAHHLMSRPSGIVLHYLKLAKPGEKPLLGLPAAESAALWRRLTSLPPVVSSGRHEAMAGKTFSRLFHLSSLPKSPWTSFRMRQLLLSLLTTIIEQSGEARDSDARTNRIAQVADLIRKNPENSYTVTRLAKMANLSQTHFINLFRRTTGLPPVKFQIECRIQRAKKLLRDSSLAISDIALQLGFNSHQHFSDTFSRIVGVPPKTWRSSSTSSRRRVRSSPS